METGYLWIREVQWTTVTVLSPGGILTVTWILNSENSQETYEKA